MNSLRDLVANRLKELGLGEVEAASRGGMERSYIRDLIKGRKESVRADKLVALAKALELDASALAEGRAVPLEILRSEPRIKLVQSFDPDNDDFQDEEESHGYNREHWRSHVDGALPEIDVKLGAGEGSIGEIINLQVGAGNVSGHRVVAEWLIPQEYLRNEVKASPTNTIVMEVIGDSMFPTYSPGDRVIVDLAQNRFLSDTVYAISDGVSEPQIKRLQRVMFSDPVEVKIISDNPNLETFTVELERLTIIGRICGHIARK